MASRESIDPKTGYCSSTRTYHNLRSTIPLPPESTPLSISDVILSLSHSSSTTNAFIDAGTGKSLSYSHFLHQVRSLSSSLRHETNIFPPINSGDVALILSPSSLKIPILYFSLLSIGAVVSPANPLLSDSELSHILRIANPTVVFAVSSLINRLPSSLPTIILDSTEFESFLTQSDSRRVYSASLSVSQSDRAAIVYSSGTTGMMKGVELTHRNLITLISALYHTTPIRQSPAVWLLTLPLFHVYGFFMLLRAVAVADTSVLLAKFSLEGMMSAVERYKVTHAPVSPPVVVLMVKSELTARFDLLSLEMIRCGGAPLNADIVRRFKAKFPWIVCAQGYGLTETSGTAARPLGPEECERYGSVGRLFPLMEAKIVDPSTGEALPPGYQGEMWLRGPTIMKGYVGDEESTRATFSEGWLKTGDICYFDCDGYVFVVDRLKELIKYKGYQVPPVELETVLLSHPEVADAAVIPYPDEVAGELPMAFVVRAAGSCIKGTEIKDFVAKEVAPYKKIRRVSFINTIPRSPQGKILRRQLVNQAVSAASPRL